jgi:hypothetical protein
MSARGVPQFDEETGRPINVDRWQSAEYEVSVQHKEQVWWLLAPNPFAVLADSTSGAVEWERTSVDPAPDDPRTCAIGS